MQYGPVLDFPLKDKVVLITGGGAGIGLAFAQTCHAQGAKVLIGDLRLAPEASDWTSTLSPSTFHFQTTNVSDWSSLHALITASVSAFGDVPDVYAPVAGVFEPLWSNFWDDSESAQGHYKTVSINVEHPLKLTRMALRALAGAEKQGVVCLVASTAGVRGNFLSCLYASSKHAVVGFAKSMGMADREMGVRVVCICPGYVQSLFWFL